jgi:hypothetical protein
MFFFEKKNQKTFAIWRTWPGQGTRHWANVFLFFSSETKTFFLRRPRLIITAVGLAHRASVAIRFDDVLTGLAAGHPQISVAQLYPLAIFNGHFWRGLWLLQQSPPLPVVIMKLALSLASWPVGVARLLCTLDFGIAIVTSCLLFGLVRRVTGSALAGYGLALWFLLSTDLLVLDTAFLGQEFYENLGMLFVTACCAITPLAAAPRARLRGAVLLGVMAALAPLSRASLSYFPLVPLCAGGLGWRPKMLAAYLAPVLLLHGAWAAKTYLVFGHSGWETSSWSGLNAADGLDKAGHGAALCRDILAAPPVVYPDWFRSLAKPCPSPFIAAVFGDMPPAVRAFDAAMTAQLGGIPVFPNSLADSLVSQQYRRAVARYDLAHPRQFAGQIARAYRLLWQRIGDYGAQYVDPLFVQPVDRGFPGLLHRGFGETQRVMLSRKAEGFVPPPPVTRPAWFGTVSLAPLDAVSIVCLHGLFPILAGMDVWRRWRGRAGVLPPGSWMLAATVGYGMIVFTAVDMGENMRFRLAIEPAIIALTAACLAGWWGLVRRRAAGRGQPPAGRATAVASHLGRQDLA